MKLYYELIDNGYIIKDKDDMSFGIHQYEPYIPYRENIEDKDYDKLAKLHILFLEKEKDDLNMQKEKIDLIKNSLDTLINI